MGQGDGMTAVRVITPQRARYALGAIRLLNGVVALGAPKLLIKTFGEDPDQHGPAIYALRLFGVRTIVLGVQLLFAGGDTLDDRLRYAVPIHAADTTAAVLSGVSRQLPPRAALTGVALSSVNTVLAVFARQSVA
jgi:hypothetical protein